MKHTVIFDCEFLTAEGAPVRFWCGPYDPDPVIAQIGAVKIGLEDDFPILDSLRIHVVPRDRSGSRVPLDPFFTRLTGIDDDMIDREGVPLVQALDQIDSFADGAMMWSWGKDEFNMVAISCYVQGIAPPIPVTRFGNACRLFLMAGMPYEDMKKTPSNHLADYYGVQHPPLRGHDALDDARSVAFAIRHVLQQGLLDPEYCQRPIALQDAIAAGNTR